MPASCGEKMLPTRLSSLKALKEKDFHLQRIATKYSALIYSAHSLPLTK